jgi:hypothetical protein
VESPSRKAAVEFIVAELRKAGAFPDAASEDKEAWEELDPN